MKARPETTSTTTKTSIQALALAVSVLGLVRALILLNATAAGFQSLDPQAPPPPPPLPPPPPPPPRDMVALFAMKAIHTLAHITNTYIWPQTDFFFFGQKRFIKNTGKQTPAIAYELQTGLDSRRSSLL